MIVVIDGPAGSGKSSTAKAVAQQLGIQYLDSGALYRAATLVFIRANEVTEAFLELLKENQILFQFKEGNFEVFIDSENVSEEIRTMEVSNLVSTVASMPQVRAHINRLMNKVVEDGMFIADGRDLGTAVFPNAVLKFFMVADAETRAIRRLKDLKNTGVEVTLEDVIQNIEERDHTDSNRAADPLMKANDAIEIDSGTFTFQEQVDFISEKIKPLIQSHN
ncbi:MAG: (d)CMP kinase [Balneolales bacterium]|nr:(d)CMP kinase [Balneolales bacterium]